MIYIYILKFFKGCVCMCLNDYDMYDVYDVYYMHYVLLQDVCLCNVEWKRKKGSVLTYKNSIHYRDVNTHHNTKIVYKSYTKYYISHVYQKEV